MQVRGPRSNEVVSVFWDEGATDNFVRTRYAEAAGFSYRMQRMSVTTLGGEETVRDSRIYQCRIRDKEGKIYEFEAIGLEEVTGPWAN